jgi:hypothetical protein
MADEIKFTLRINGEPLFIFQNSLSKTNRYIRYNKNASNAPQHKQVEDIIDILNQSGNITKRARTTERSNTKIIDFEVEKTSKIKEDEIYNKIQNYLDGGATAAQSPTTITRGQTIKSAAAMQQQGPKTYILPITGTIIKEDKNVASLFHFQLPFYDQNDYDELLDDFIQYTSFVQWGTNVNVNTADFSFQIRKNALEVETEGDLATLDKQIEDYLEKYLAQKNAPAAAQPAAQPAAAQSVVANLGGIKLGEPYFLLPVTQIQVYKVDVFNVPIYSFYLTGQKGLANMVQEALRLIENNDIAVFGSSTLIKDNPELYKIEFELLTEKLDDQENIFLALDYVLQAQGYIKPYTPTAAPQIIAPKPDAVIDIEANVDKLKTELEQLVFLRSLNSELEFEKNIELGQKIANVKEKINELNFSKLQAKISTDDIFDQLFEQSFTPILHQYTDVKVPQGQEGDFFTPNGQPSQLSEQLNEIIRTQQFKDWFGDWQLTYMYKQAGDTDTDCSVVLTENFEPKLFYHGTGQAFSYFKFDQFPAAYFAANQDYSQFFANLHGGGDGYVIPFFLNVRNPLDLTLFGTELIKPKEFFDYMFLQTGFDADQLEANPLFYNPTAPPVECWRYLRNNPKMLKKLADNQVYDGIHFYETNPGVPEGLPAHSTEVFITFKADQCKIADNDRGLILLGALKSFLLEKGGKI